MKMLEISVETVEGDIAITQRDSDLGVNIVYMSADQADLVCQWIMDAEKELRPAKKPVLRD